MRPLLCAFVVHRAASTPVARPPLRRRGGKWLPDEAANT